MNNPFFRTIKSRLLYAGIWMTIIVVQILLLRFYFHTSREIYFQCSLYDALISNFLQALCLLALWYPVQYYRNIVSVPLFILFHWLLFVIALVIWLGGGFLIIYAGFARYPFYPEFFLHLLPVRLLFGVFVYILFTLVYYLYSTNIREQEKSIEEANTETHPAPVERLSRISIKRRQEIRFIPVGQIHCIEANGDYVMIYTSDGKFLKDKTMKYWETCLPDDTFVRIHRSFIVNIEWIDKIELYEKETYKIQLKNGNSLKVSSSGYKLLKQKMQL